MAHRAMWTSCRFCWHANISAADYDQRTCLHLAASAGNLTIVKLLVEAKADVNFKDRWKGTPLVDAVRHGHMEVAKLLRACGGELGYDEKTTSGELCELARNGSLDLLKVLLSCGAQVNSADYDQRT
jgi:potassium channel